MIVFPILTFSTDLDLTVAERGRLRDALADAYRDLATDDRPVYVDHIDPVLD